MKTLVERLREPVMGWSGDAFAVDDATAEEAAAEIEQLRAELVYISMTLSDGPLRDHVLKSLSQQKMTNDEK